MLIALNFRRSILILFAIIVILTVGFILVSGSRDAVEDHSPSKAIRSGGVEGSSTSSSPNTRVVRTSRERSESSVATSDHLEVRRVLSAVNEFEARRAKTTFDSNINGRRHVFMEVSAPTNDELKVIRQMVSELTEFRAMSDGSRLKWATFIRDQYYLNDPTSYTIQVGETRSGDFFSYSISPSEENASVPRIHGSVGVDTILDEKALWRLSHLVSFEEAKILEEAAAKE